jgi:hypothetical protein
MGTRRKLRVECCVLRVAAYLRSFGQGQEGVDRMREVTSAGLASLPGCSGPLNL